MGDKKTGFFVDGSWEKSYLDIMFGSAVQVTSSSLDMAVGRGFLTVQAIADFYLTFTAGLFITSNNVILCGIKQLRKSKTETSADDVRVVLNRVEATANQSRTSAEEVQAAIDTLKTRLEDAIASVDASSFDLLFLGAVAESNEATLDSLRAGGNDTEMIGNHSDAVLAEEEARGGSSSMSGSNTDINGSDIAAKGTTTDTSATRSQVSGISSDLSVMTDHV